MKMTGENHGVILRGIEQIFNQGSLTGLSEGQLLGRFAGGDEGAFEALVTRHGPMVLGICRRLLYDRRDVEDAFQATFLVLLRKARALRDPEGLSPWLHSVAYRVAARIRSNSARRPAEESRGARPEAVEAACELERSELRALLDEEIHRLPEKYRRPVVLCYLEGRTHEEAARRLRCSAGSVRGRLDRARQKLKDRLGRRGVAPAAGLAALAAGAESASAAVPAPLIAGTIATLTRAATATAVSGAASVSALELADAVFRGMIVAKLKVAALLVAGMIALGAMSLVVALEPNGPRMATRTAPTPSGPARAPVGHPNDRKESEPQPGITVTGRVLDEAGRPIAGARVARGSDLRGQEAVPEAATDADGRFALMGVSPGPTVLTVQARGHEPDLKTVTAGPGLAPVEFRLGAGHAILGRIVDAHDKPIAGAPIAADEWRGHHSLRWSTRTDDEGRFRWDEAPTDVVMIDLGTLGFSAKRYWQATPDAPEKTIPMRRPLRVRGRVNDAETGRPIRTFTLVPGWADENGRVWQWQYDRAQQVSGLSFDVLLTTDMAGLRAVRIEADGYLPRVERMLKDEHEELIVNFGLRKGTGPAGVVRGPDGKPLAGAAVVLVAPTQPAFLTNGQPPATADHRVIKTGADGSYAFRPQEPPYTILVLDDRGFAERNVRDAGTSPAADLTVRPWGRIEGTLRIGNRPAAGEKLRLTYEQPGDTPAALPWWSGEATADAEGRFAFERVMPGEGLVSREFVIKASASGQTLGHSHGTRVAVAPGETVRLSLGGAGRSVVGKVAAPAGSAAPIDWTFSLNTLMRKEPTQEESLARALAGKKPSRIREGSTVKLEADGTFRIEDVEAGTYDLIFIVNRPPRDPSGMTIGNEAIATARREVIVPPMPGGRSDEPLDIGTIPAEAVK
jgi:RNA polymerase sigma factor (sigma-70 family)